jgi:hypothetical protein
LETIASKQACFIKTNKYFHINKNDAGYHKAHMLALARNAHWHLPHRSRAHALQASKQACFFNLPKIGHSTKELAIRTDVAFSFTPGT